MFKVVLEYEVGKPEFKEVPGIIAQLQTIANNAKAQLQTIPGPPKYPIRWTTERQRRAFFASNGFGRGIPTKRTGAVAKAWRFDVDTQALKDWYQHYINVVLFAVNINPAKERSKIGRPPSESVIVTIDNPVSYERYVTGIQQQGFHKDTGWVYAPPIIEGAVTQVEAVMGMSFEDDILR